MLCSLVVISQLVRLSNLLIAFGLSVENIFFPILYITAPFLHTLIPVALLFGVMIAISQLCNDGEYAVLQSFGYSVKRVAFPVIIFSTVLFAISLMCSVYVESWGRREFINFVHEKTQTKLDNLTRYQIQPKIFTKNFLDYILYAEQISQDRSRYTNVMLTPNHDNYRLNFIMMAPYAEVKGSVADSNLRMIFYRGTSISLNSDTNETNIFSFERADIDLLRILNDKILGQDIKKLDYRSLSYDDLLENIAESERTKDTSTYLKSYYLFHSRFAFPFIIFAFAIMGMLLGIKDQRNANQKNYIVTIFFSILSFILVNLFKWFAEKDFFHVVLAAWLPPLLLFGVALYLLYLRDKTPLNDSIFK